MKKTILAILVLLLALSLCACGGGNTAGGSGPAGSSAAEPGATAETTSPYNWLGYAEVPRCAYLDFIASQHYYREYTSYIELGGEAMGAEYIEATDGTNTYTEDVTDGGSKTYNLGGMCYYITELAKSYLTQDLTALMEGNPTVADQIAANQNNTGKKFKGTGTGTVPIYETVDSAEYEYYEYVTGSGEMMLTERLYLKDGDVFAIYSRVGGDTTMTEYSTVITKITGDIPANIFELPDLSGYTDETEADTE